MSQPQFLYLATTGWKTGRQHRIEIWFVEYNGRYYIVSEHPERAHWVQNIAHSPQVSFSVGDRTFQGTARPVEPGSELAAAVSKLMDAKYRWSQGLIVELAP
ncbi:MAG: nitroreductase/quinone reductase family protein [Nitrososphaera sp.]|uniref:nitroreductase/quinone reductase family protein n=1 Tax=Nitrososphaera sp. TaxID=1971748 RepID=UPI003D6F92D5